MVQAVKWWIFLGLAPLCYWLLPARWRTGFLGACSIALLASFLGWDLLAMGAIAGLSYAGAGSSPRRPRSGVAPLWVLVCLILLYLIWSKYLPGLARALAGEGTFVDVAAPIGISYFCFKLMHYVTERRRGTLPQHGVQDFACWLFLAPIFTAGPIERFDHFQSEAETRQFEYRFVSEGLTRIAQGLVKKFLLGLIVIEILQKVTGGGLSSLLEGPPKPAMVWCGLALTLLVVYLDFSAYSDIAIGSSRLFGYRIMENFNFPFAARSLQEFWQRWHMSLANWCRAYVYMPMIGLTRNPYYATIATFFVMGLWHSVSLNWIAWGIWHGVGLAWLMFWGRYAQKRKLTLRRTIAGSLLARTLTIGYVTLGGAFTAMHGRAPFADSLRLMARAFGVEA